MINTKLIEKFYECASIQRWNDHVRPVEFTELDKQAHKMIIAYVIAKFEESHAGCKFDWEKLIEGGIFELLQRAILTDIKSPVFHQMLKDRREDINRFVFDKLIKDCFDNKKEDPFVSRFEQYFSDNDYSNQEKRILKAAHYLATNWEFKIIYNVAPFIYGVERTKQMIEDEIEDYYDLDGVQRIMLGKKSYGFIDLCGQLRFQSRWAQSPRIPKTTVLGHMLIVASIIYLCSLEINACKKRKFNNFYCALFHDLPEVLTRDIVSPVKKLVTGLPEWLKDYERKQIEDKLLPLLPKEWHEELKSFMVDEFKNKVKGLEMKNGEEIMDRYNNDDFFPLDGTLVKACDDLAAFIEAAISVNHGIKSHHLKDGLEIISKKYKDKPIVYGINFNDILQEFLELYPKE